MAYIFQAFIRGIIPFGIMSIISLIMKFQNMDHFQIKSTFLTGIIISVVAAASVIYDVEGWSLGKQSAIHFVIMSITVLPCLFISDWFPLNHLGDYVKVIGIFLVVGLILWTVSYFVFGKLLG